MSDEETNMPIQSAAVETAGNRYQVNLLLADEVDPETATNLIQISVLVAVQRENPSFVGLQAIALRRVRDTISAALRATERRLDQDG